MKEDVASEAVAGLRQCWRSLYEPQGSQVGCCSILSSLRVALGTRSRSGAGYVQGWCSRPQ